MPENPYIQAPVRLVEQLKDAHYVSGNRIALSSLSSLRRVAHRLQAK